LVTGGAGFIGRHLVQQLLQAGDAVRVLDLRKPPFPDAQVEFIQGSVLDKDKVERAVRGVDHLYHLAANAHLWALRRADFEQPNYEGARLVMDQAALQGVKRVVFTSTEAILGNYRQSTGGLINEDTPLPPLEAMAGPYTRSKWRAEEDVRRRIAEGFPANIVYPTTPIGPGDFNLTAPTRMIMDFLNRKTPAYFNCTLNFVDVRRVARGHLLALRRGRVGERYILGEHNLELGQLLRQLEAVSGIAMPRRHVPYALAITSAAVAELISNNFSKRAPIASREGVRLTRAHLTFDCGKAQRELGLDSIPIEASLRETARWLSQQGFLKTQADL